MYTWDPDHMQMCRCDMRHDDICGAACSETLYTFSAHFVRQGPAHAARVRVCERRPNHKEGTKSVLDSAEMSLGLSLSNTDGPLPRNPTEKHHLRSPTV